ncbi:MAG: hypothetical protein ACR2IT_00550, partial [Pirellulales bacterium]
RNVPDNTVDLPSFRHLVGGFEMALSDSKPRDEIERLLHPFHRLASDVAFWRHTHEGLAVLASDGRAQVFLLPRSVKPLAVITGRFHMLPLIRVATSLKRCHVLALTSREARVFAGTVWHDPAGTMLDRLDPVPLVAVPGKEPNEVLARGDVIDEETFEPHRVERGMGPAGKAGTTAVHGGVGSKRDDADADTEIFLRHVDSVVREQVSRSSGLPLVLVAAPRLAAAFRGLSRNALLLEDSVAKDPHLMRPGELTTAVAAVFSAAIAAEIVRDVRAFGHARDRDLAAGDLTDIGRAAVAGRVATLLIEADRFEPGVFDRRTGAIAFGAAPAGSRGAGRAAPVIDAEDVVAAVAETVLLHGGTILALARNDMPTESGVAAIYRY